MSKVATEMTSPIIAWPSIAPMPVNTRQIEEFQSAVRDEMALLDVLQNNGTDWMARRLEALESGLRAVSTMSSAKTPIAAASICGEWLRGSVQRINADIMGAFDFSAQAAAATQRVIQAVWTNDAGATAERPAASIPSPPAETESKLRAAA